MHSMRRTKLESTVRYLGIEVEDALSISEKLEIRSQTSAALLSGSVASTLLADIGRAAEGTRPPDQDRALPREPRRTQSRTVNRHWAYHRKYRTPHSHYSD
jgi:hypothetical protein